MSEPFEGEDNLGLDLEVRGQQEWARDLRRARQIAEENADSINDSFDNNVDFTNKFNRSLLNLEQTTKKLSGEFRNISTREFGRDLQHINDDARKAALRVEELQLEIKQLDAVLSRSSNVSPERFAADTENIRNEIAFLQRQLLSFQQLSLQQGPLRDPGTIAPIDYNSRDSRQFLTAQRELNRIEREFAKIRDTDLGKGFDDVKRSATQALPRIDELRSKIKSLDQDLKNTTSKTKLDQIRSEARVALHEVEQLKRELVEMNISGSLNNRGSYRSRRGFFSQIGQGVGIQGFGSGLGVVAGVAAAGYGLERFINLSEIAVERATEQVRVNRLLASSAAEVGTSYDNLATKNRQYADLAALSITKTGEFTAKVAQLATRTARPESVDRLAKSFLDLGAARGLESEELKTIIQQIITGQDEGYKKLLLPNPSLLYKQAADKQGRSVESLSALERARIFEDEFTKKAALFAGAAQARLESLDGQIAKTRATYENFIDVLSTNYASSRGVFEFIHTLEDAIKSLGFTTDQVREKLAQGLTPNQIVDQQNQDISAYGILQKSRALGYGIGGAAMNPFARFFGLFGAEKPGQVRDYAINSAYNELSGSNDELFRDEQLRRINALIRQDAQQRKVAEEGLKRLQEQNAEEDTRREASIAERQFNRFLTKRNVSVEEIQKRYNEFLQQASKDENEIYFNKEKLEDIAEKVGKIISQSLMKGFRLVLEDPNVNFDKLQAGLSKVRGESRLDDDDRKSLVQDFEKAIETQTNRVRALRKETEAFLLDLYSKDNPFVRLFSEMETASARAEQRFGIFGKAFVDLMAQMERAQIKLQIAQTKYLSDVKVLDYSQQAEALSKLSYQQTNGFQRNLQFAQDSASFVNESRGLSEQARLADFYANVFDPRSRFNNANIYGSGGYLESVYGAGGVEQLARGYTGGVSRDQFIDTQIQINNLKEDLLKFQKIDISRLGVLGQAVIADAIDSRIPNNQELFQRLNSFGETREDARELLGLRARNARTRSDAARERFNELIRNQEVAERTRRFAEEKVALLRSQTGLNQAFTAEQLLAITSELGPGELTANLRNERLQALSLAKDAEQRKITEGEEREKQIVSILTSIENALTNKGIKLEKSTTPLLDVNINNNSGGAVSTIFRPGQNDVLDRMGN